MTLCCPHCHQPLAEVRAGVRMPALKVRLFDAIEAAGAIGIPTRELMTEIYRDRRPPKTAATIRNHILQINELLIGTGVRIKSLDHKHWTVVKLRKRSVRFTEDAPQPIESQ